MYCFVVRSIYFTSKNTVSVCEIILYIHNCINSSACEKNLEVLHLASEKFDKETIKQIKKLSENEKDFILISMFSLLFQTSSSKDWKESTNEKDLEHLENIFDRVF